MMVVFCDVEVSIYHCNAQVCLSRRMMEIWERWRLRFVDLGQNTIKVPNALKAKIWTLKARVTWFSLATKYIYKFFLLIK